VVLLLICDMQIYIPRHGFQINFSTTKSMMITDLRTNAGFMARTYDHEFLLTV
jgi:hypothetical protein